MKMKKRLLLYRVGADDGYLTVSQGVEPPIDVLPRGTKAQFTLGDSAMPFTRIALYPMIKQLLIEPGFSDSIISQIGIHNWSFGVFWSSPFGPAVVKETRLRFSDFRKAYRMRRTTLCRPKTR